MAAFLCQTTGEVQLKKKNHKQQWNNTFIYLYLFLDKSEMNPTYRYVEKYSI